MLTMSADSECSTGCRANAGARLCVSSELCPPAPLDNVRVLPPEALPSAAPCSVASEDAALLALRSSCITPPLPPCMCRDLLGQSERVEISWKPWINIEQCAEADSRILRIKCPREGQSFSARHVSRHNNGIIEVQTCDRALPPALRARNASAAAHDAWEGLGPAGIRAAAREVMSRGWMVSCTASRGASASDPVWLLSIWPAPYMALNAAAAAAAAAARALGRGCVTAGHATLDDADSMSGDGRIT